MYKAANWMHLGRTRGFARANGRYTDPHGVPKELYARALSRDARRRLRGADALPAALAPNPMGGGSGRRPPELRSLYDELMRVPDFRRAQGRKHTIASVLAVHILALLADMHGCLAAAQYAKSLNQTELEALGAWHNPKSGQFVPVSKSTLHRVVANADPAAVEAVLRRYAAPRLQIGQALATDGKRIRGANRNGDSHFETATIVEHGTGVPFASLNFHDEGGEVAAVRALLEEVPVAGRVITIDALHTVRDTARAIVETHGADYLMTVKRNAQETFRTLETIDWERDATGGFDEAFDKAHGRIERRRIRVLTPLRGTVNYPHLSQVFRVERLRIGLKSGTESTEFAYGITSVPQHKGTPEQLLAWNRGHWSVENKNHRTRDVHFEEDACLARTGKQCAVQLHRARRYSRQWPRKGRAGDAALRTTPGGRLQGRALLRLRPPFLKPAAPLPPATCAVKQRAIRTGQSPYPPTNHPGGGAALPIRNRMNQQNSANPRRQKTAVGPKQPAWESPDVNPPAILRHHEPSPSIAASISALSR